METRLAFVPLAAIIAMLAMTWYLLAMPVSLDNARASGSWMQTPSSALVLDAR